MESYSIEAILKANVGDYVSGMKEAKSQMKSFVDKNQETFDSFRKVGTVMTAAGTGIAAGLGGAVKIAADFEQGMSKVAAISGATDEELKQLTASAREWGSKTKFSATEASDAFSYMAMAGWKTGDMLDGVGGIINLAAASGEDLALTADILTDGLTAFGMSAKDSGKFADVLAAASSNANTNVSMLGESFKYVAPLAGAMGYSAEDVSLALGLMANAGVKGSQAGTSLKTMFTNLAKPTKAMQGAMNQLGISLTDSSGNMKSMDEVIGDLRTGFGGLDEAQQANYAATIFGKEAMAGALAVINASEEDYNKLSEAINNSEGAAENMAAVMQDNLNGAMTNLKSAFEEVAISIGDVLLPYVKEMVAFVQSLADKFNGLDEKTKTTIAVIAALSAGFLLLTGPILLLIGFIPQMLAGFAAISTVISTLTAAFVPAAAGATAVGGAATATGGALTALTGPIGLVVVAIAGIVAGLVVAYKKVDWFREEVDKAWAKIKELTSKAFTAIKETITVILKDVVKFGSDILNKFKDFWAENGQAILALVKLYFNNIKEQIKMVMGIIQGIFEVVWPIISGVVKVAWELIKTVVSTAIDIVLGIIQTVMKLIQGDWEGAWESIKETAQRIMDNIVNFFKDIDLVQIGKDIINGLIKGIGSMVGAVGDAIKNIGSNIKDTFTSFFGIRSPSRLFMGYGENIGEGLEGGIASTSAQNRRAIEGVSKVISAATRANVREVEKIAGDAEKKRTEIQQEYAKKRAELSRKSASSSQSALKTHKNKKGEIVTTGEAKVLKIRQDASAKLTKLNEDEQKKLASINDKAWANIVKQENKVAKERLEAVKTYVNDKKSMEELSIVAESEVWRKSIAVFREGTKERVEAQKEYQKALKVINDEVTKVNEEYSGRMTEINDKLRRDEKELTDTYTKTVDDRANALVNFAGTFDYFEYKLEQSGTDLLNNLKSQISAFKEWERQIDILSSKAIDKGLIEELRAMGPKALPQLVALNSMTDKQMTEYSKLYGEKSKMARTIAEKELIGMKNDTQKRIKELQNVANAELGSLEREWTNKIQGITRATDGELQSLKKIGRQAAEGLKAGLDSMAPALVRTATDIANSVKKAMEGAFQIKSPSRWMRDHIGVNMMEGWIVGMEGMRRQVLATSGHASDWMTPDIPRTGGSGATGGYRNSSETTNRSVTNNQPINVVLNYNGSGTREDALDMVDIVAVGLESRVRSQNRYNGNKK